ncbi:Rz1-like lysis system protein LysC [Pseudomonas sp. UBA6310]|uniref:Rz1-like lysis system protein LysC n=1 Tax=Pseudomonas sp. UBA6310 TaxID=1947327 RepID=UPI0032E4D5E1
MTRTSTLGPLSLCLLLLAGCTLVPQSPEQTPTVTGCPVVTRCSLPPAAPQDNGDLSDADDAVLAAWADCAAKVDVIYQHNQREAQP